MKQFVPTAIERKIQLNNFILSGVEGNRRQIFIIVPVAGYDGKLEIVSDLHAFTLESVPFPIAHFIFLG